jgi:hypothetical protein
MDAKLQSVMLDYGLEGYGLYWYCIELIAQRVNGENLTFELEHDAKIIARNTGSTPQKVEQMMTSFINLGLLNADNGHVFCLKLASRCDDFTAKAVRRNGVKTVINQSVGVSPILSDKVHLEEEEEVRRKKKEIDKKNKESPRFSPPTHQEALVYFTEQGANDSNEAHKFIDFYEMKGWMVGKNKMKDWKAAVRNWLKNYTAASNGQSPQERKKPRGFGQ